jgi:hypothetical protein
VHIAEFRLVEKSIAMDEAEKLPSVAIVMPVYNT